MGESLKYTHCGSPTGKIPHLLALKLAKLIRRSISGLLCLHLCSDPNTNFEVVCLCRLGVTCVPGDQSTTRLTSEGGVGGAAAKGAVSWLVITLTCIRATLTSDVVSLHW